MSTRARAKKPVFTPTMDTAEKVNLIRSGKKKKTVSGFKEKQNITITDEGGKVIAVQKEKKVEETGVTKQKRNFIEFESKLGTERNTDIRKIKGPTLRAVEPRVEEKIIMKKKKKEYLDNFQYRETKNFKKNPSKPSIVIHRRLGDIYGATVEEVQYIKTTTDVRPGNSVDKNRPGQLKSILKQNKSVSNLRSKPQINQPRAVATKTTTTTTKVTKKTTGLAGGPTSKTTTKTTTTTSRGSRGGDRATKTRTSSATRNSRGKK
jgi:hypothetical protein